MASIPNAIATAQDVTTKVGAMIPLGQISSVVQTLSNIQGFNPGSFSQLAGSIQSALSGIDQLTSIVQNFAGGSPADAFVNTLNSIGLAGSSVSQIAGAAASAYQQADSFLSGVAQAQSWQQLNSQRPSVEQSREMNRSLGGSLFFPLDIGKYWISLSFESADYNSIMGSQQGFYRRTASGGVILPVPMNLTDVNKLDYKPISLTAEAAKPVMQGIEGIAAGIGGLTSFVTDALKGGYESASALTGLAINTHQTLKFNQPVLKDHSFTWKLVPSNADESKVLFEIIKFIKSRIYPRKNVAVFKYPDLVNVVLFNGEQMFFFKPAYVQGFSVNYTTEGGPAFHKDGYPASVQLEMSITENAVWTASDYGMSDVTLSEVGNLLSTAGLGALNDVFGGQGQ